MILAEAHALLKTQYYLASTISVIMLGEGDVQPRILISAFIATSTSYRKKLSARNQARNSRLIPQSIGRM